MAQDITNKRPSECTNITDVRNEIDSIDKEIVELLGLRFQYVKEVVKYKSKDRSSIEADDRRKAVLECRRKWAEDNGLSADVVEHIYDYLIKYFIEEEMKLVD